MLVLGREAAGIWEGEWHFVLGSGILEDSSLPFAPVENVCGASLKTHWTTEWERFFAGVLCERVAISSWGLLLPLLPWGVMQIKVAARFETYCSLFWVVLLQALLPEMCEQQGDVYLHAAVQFWNNLGMTRSCVPLKLGQSTTKCSRCIVFWLGLVCSHGNAIPSSPGH